jgi:hypothetical protein
MKVLASTSLASVLAAGLLAGGMLSDSARAADLGGNCCADLEERIAELEATTARKGNRKVSLTLSGWVAQQIMWYDNGADSNVYVTGVGSTLSSHVKATGSAQITPDWSAGYVLHLEINTSDPLTAGNTEYGPSGPSGLHIVKSNGDELSPSVDTLYSFWFLKSETLGKVSVGSIPQASQHAAALVDGSGSLIPANWVPLDGMGINVSRNGTALQLPGAGFPVGALMWCGSTGLPLAGDCNAIPLNGIRYDSPTFAGFSVSASWGEDDFWDVAARYAGEFGGFKFGATAAYHHNADENLFQGFNTVTGLSAFNVVKADAGYLQLGGYLEHISSGLFLYGAYGKEWNDNVYDDAGIGAPITASQPSGDVWYLKAGLRKKWTSLGQTVLYGEYGERNDMFHQALPAFGVTGSNLTQWGLGAVQDIDAAAMSLWVNYKNYDPSFSGPGVAGAWDNLDDISVVTAGAMISF